MNAEYGRLLRGELRKERHRAGWTCSEVARKLSPPVAGGAVGHWERGVREIGLTRVLELCALYGVELSVLAGRVEQQLGSSLPVAAFVPSVWGPVSTGGRERRCFGCGWEQTISEGASDSRVDLR